MLAWQILVNTATSASFCRTAAQRQRWMGSNTYICNVMLHFVQKHPEWERKKRQHCFIYKSLICLRLKMSLLEIKMFIFLCGMFNCRTGQI